MDVTPRKRSAIPTLNKPTNKSQREISAITSGNQSTVNRILKGIQTRGTFSPQPRKKCGRKRKTSTKSEAGLIRESKKHPRKTSSALKQSLGQAGLNITLLSGRGCMRLTVARRPVTKQLLTDVMKKKGSPGHCSIKAGQKKTGEKLCLAIIATSLSKGREFSMFVVR